MSLIAMHSIRPALIGSALLLAALLSPLRAADDAPNKPVPAGFILTLSNADQTAAGLTKLSADEQTTLNILIAREVALARQGGVNGFAGTFISRRRPEERTAAGIDRLSDAEQAKLNDLVARALAAGPARNETASRWRREDSVSERQRVQVHGDVTVAYGWGGGREFRSGSVYTDIYDPNTGVSLGVGLSQFSGDGWFGGYGGYRGGFGGGRGACFGRH